jgi:AcrR family transcriptional regulator
VTRETLNRDKVLDAALRLAAETGPAGLSMRRLAASLGVEAMSLYNHVASKADLLDGMVARVFESVPLPDPALPWDERLRRLGGELHAAFVRHAAVLPTLRGQADPRSAGALRVIDATVGALLDAGLDERSALLGYRALMSLVAGESATGPDRPWYGPLVDPAATPHLYRVLPALAAGGGHDDFGYQLEILIAGLRATAG